MRKPQVVRQVNPVAASTRANANKPAAKSDTRRIAMSVQDRVQAATNFHRDLMVKKF